jgi:hypothetical protein
MDTNPVVQILGFEHENAYVKDVFLFLYTVTVVQSFKGKNFVHQGAVSMLRAFGSFGLCVPLILGALPSSMFKQFDQYFLTLAGAMVFVAVVYDRIFTGDLAKHFDKLTNLAYCVVKGNAAGHGYVMVATILPESIAAPFIGTYLAVNGHRILEKGIQTVGASALFDEDTLLAVFGGFLYYGMIEYVRVSALVARLVLILFRVSCDYVDYNHILNNICSAVGGNTGAASGRGRSRTPKRK